MEHVLEPTLISALFWAATAALGAELLLLGGRVRPDAARAPRGRRRAGRGSLLAIALAMGLAFGINSACHAQGWGNLPEPIAGWVRGLGVTLYAAGALLRLWAGRCLGAEFTREVRARPEQPLVSHGPYRRLRHPLYTGLLAVALGLCAQFANLPGLLAAALLPGLALGWRVREEERLLEATIGERYTRWRRGRGRLLPSWRAAPPGAGPP